MDMVITTTIIIIEIMQIRYFQKEFLWDTDFWNTVIFFILLTKIYLIAHPALAVHILVS